MKLIIPEWARALIPEADLDRLVEKRGGYQPVARGPSPTVPPPKRADAAQARPS